MELIKAFEQLPAEEKQIVAREILSRLAPFDSGPLSDEEIAHAGDQLAQILEQEENDSAAR